MSLFNIAFQFVHSLSREKRKPSRIEIRELQERTTTIVGWIQFLAGIAILSLLIWGVTVYAEALLTDVISASLIIMLLLLYRLFNPPVTVKKQRLEK